MDYNPNAPVCSGDIMLLIQQIAQGNYPWWFPNKAKGLAIDFFIYGTDFLPLTASLTTTNNINIDGGSAFYIVSTALVETATDNTTFLAQRPITCSMLDTGSGRQLSNIAIHVDNWFGTAQRPFLWPIPKLIAPNSTFSVTLANLEATDRNVRVAFHGIKIFNFTPTVSP